MPGIVIGTIQLLYVIICALNKNNKINGKAILHKNAIPLIWNCIFVFTCGISIIWADNVELVYQIIPQLYMRFCLILFISSFFKSKKDITYGILAYLFSCGYMMLKMLVYMVAHPANYFNNVIFYKVCEGACGVNFNQVAQTLAIGIIFSLMEYVGLNSLFASILQVLSLAELGFGSAIIFSMYKPIATNDLAEIGALLNLYRKTYHIIGGIILCVGMFLVPFLNHLISGGYPENINIQILYLIYLFNTVSSYFLYAYKQSLLLAYQRVDVDSNIATIVNIVMYVIQILALVFTSNYYCYIVWLPISTIVINLWRNAKISRMFPNIQCVGNVSIEVKKDIFKRVTGLILTRICQVCRNSFDSIIISAFLGLTLLGKYQNYYYVMNTIIGFLGIVTSAVVAGIGNDVVTKSAEENYSRCKIFMSGYVTLATWCTVCLLCLYQPFMKIWVSENNMFPFELVILMCLYFYFLKLGDIVAVYKDATGIYWEDRARPIVESVANLIMNVAFVKMWGVYGVVISTIVSILFINIPWSTHILFKTYFKISEKEYYLKLGKCFFQMCITGAITLFITNRIYFYSDIFSFVIKGLVCALLTLIILLIFNFKDKEFRQFAMLLKNMMVH